MYIVSLELKWEISSLPNLTTSSPAGAGETSSNKDSILQTKLLDSKLAYLKHIFNAEWYTRETYSTVYSENC